MMRLPELPAGEQAAWERANEIAARLDLDDMLAATLAYVCELVPATGSLMYLCVPSEPLLRLQQIHGTVPPVMQRGMPPPALATDLCTAQPVYVAETATWYVPLVLGRQPVGLVGVVGLCAEQTSVPASGLVLRLLAWLTPDIARAQQLVEAQRREQRLNDLIHFMTDINTRLDNDELIELIMGRAEKLLHVEATSFWLRNEQDHRIYLLVAAGDSPGRVQRVSVAQGEGIIGHVVQTGEPLIVNDVSADAHFASWIDEQSGFQTRSLLTVPMQAPRIQRGARRGQIREHIIGGAQALNKRDGLPFTDEDVRVFALLARQAAIAFQFSQLVNDDLRLFWGIVEAISGAIDLKDPYTHGHSGRVSQFSVAIATEMGLPPEQIFHIQIGSRLHDVGKIGISEDILRKPSQLTNEEMELMKQHPTLGVRLFQDAGLEMLLQEELKALAEHHERLDGHGYPRGLHGDEISLTGRIVAVADVFEALTSDRPYRSALTVDKALAIMDEMVGGALDPACVAALRTALARGQVHVQHAEPGTAQNSLVQARVVQR